MEWMRLVLSKIVSVTPSAYVTSTDGRKWLCIRVLGIMAPTWSQAIYCTFCTRDSDPLVQHGKKQHAQQQAVVAMQQQRTQQSGRQIQNPMRETKAV